MFKPFACSFALAVVFLAPPAEAQEKTSKSVPERQPDRWRACAVTEGSETRLMVEGIYGQGGPGVVAMVTPAKPQGINAKMLILDVKVGILPGVWPAILTPIPANYTKSPYAARSYESVQIRYPDGTSIMIDKVIETRLGPTIK